VNFLSSFGVHTQGFVLARQTLEPGLHPVFSVFLIPKPDQQANNTNSANEQQPLITYEVDSSAETRPQNIHPYSHSLRFC
jgi:hypothetical protein